MGVIVSHPTGNANVRAVLRGLEHHSLLKEFHTTIAVPPISRQCRSGSFLARSNAARRQFFEAPWHKTKLHPTRETIRQLSLKLGLAALTKHEFGLASVDSVYRSLDRLVARAIRSERERVSAVYGYEDGALYSFRVAREQEIATVYELPIAHWRLIDSIFREEIDLNPEWACTLSGVNDSHSKREKKDEELSLADKVIVPSRFVADSVLLSGAVDSARIGVAPFGCPSPVESLNQAKRAPGQPIQLLFAGQLTQRKGLSYLCSALEMLEADWELTMAGPRPETLPLPLKKLLSQKRCRWLGRISHSALLKEMQRAHVFVFPTLAEGFALVIGEAISSGLPVITTPNSGADCISDGQEGYIVPIRDAEAIVERITRLDDDEQLRQEMSASAITAAEKAPWSSYEEQIVGLVRSLI